MLKTCPQIMRTVLQLYLPEENCDHAVLFNNLGPPISSTRGVAQGDNLSPFLFALALAPILQKLADRNTNAAWTVEMFIIAFMDDLTLVGPLKEIKENFIWLKTELAKIGLDVNLIKSELLVKGHVVVPPDFLEDPELQGIVITREGLKVIGVPFGTEEYQKTFLNTLLKDLKTDLKKILELESLQHQFLLLHHCWSRKPSYLLRCLDTKLTIPFTQQLNKSLFAGLSKQWDVPKPESDSASGSNSVSTSTSATTEEEDEEEAASRFPKSAQLQITLPIRDGGCHLGICEEIVHAIRFSGIMHSFPETANIEDEDVFHSTALGEETRRLFAQLQTEELPTLKDMALRNLFGATLQQSLTQEIQAKKVAILKAHSPRRMLSITDFHHAGDWLLATPNCDFTTLNADDWCKAIKLRLGLTLLIPGHDSKAGITCTCGTQFDDLGWHMFSCSKQKQAFNGRHTSLRNAWTQIIRAAGLDVYPENKMARKWRNNDNPTLSPTLRPDHLVPKYKAALCRGRRPTHLATDVSIVMPPAGGTATAAMKTRETTKINKYTDRIKPFPGYPPFDSASIDFMPLVANAFGGWNDTSAKLVKLLGRLSHTNTHKFVTPDRFSMWAWRVLSVTLQQVTATFHAHYEQLIHKRLKDRRNDFERVTLLPGVNLETSILPSNIQLHNYNHPPNRG